MAQYDLQLFGGNLINDELVDAAIQELDILFGTEETELLGDYNYGVNFEQFLWQMNPSIGQVNSYVSEKILLYTNYCRQLNIEVNCEVQMGSLRDIYVVKITFKNSAGETIKLKNWMLT